MSSSPPATSTQAWDNVLSAAIRMPGVRVDRDSYLRTMLSKHAGPSVVDAAIASTPAGAGVSPEIIARAALASIKWHRTTVSAVSFAAGLPGGWWAAATIPADVVQYFGQVLIIVQKLAYLHGWPSLTDDDNQLDDDTRLMVTLFVGVAMGNEAANNAIGKVAQGLAGQVVKRLPRQALTKYAVYNIAKQVAKWIGVKLTKETFAKGIAKVVPVVGGLVSGSLTWITFSTMANRLNKHLASLPLATGPGPASD